MAALRFCVFTLVFVAAANQPRLVDAGVVAPLLGAMHAHAANAAVVDPACTALKTLSIPGGCVVRRGGVCGGVAVWHRAAPCAFPQHAASSAVRCVCVSATVAIAVMAVG